MGEPTPANGSQSSEDLSMEVDQIEVHLFAAARAAAKTDVLRVPPGTLDEVLASCQVQVPALRDVIPRCSYLVNGVAVIDEAARLLGGDRLDVLPPFAGG